MKPSTSPSAASRSFTMVEMLVILATLVVLFCILIPSTVQEKRRRVCQNNLRQIGLAFKTFGIASYDSFSTQIPVAAGGSAELVDSGKVFVHLRVMSNAFSTPKVLVCPADKAKKAAKQFDSGFSDANVSYFVGTDASDTQPQVLLSGDRNLTVGGAALRPGLFVLNTNTPLGWTRAIHGSCGNILMADGSVQLFNSTNLATAVRRQGLATNRLVIP